MNYSLILGYPTGYSQHNTPKNGNVKSAVSVHITRGTFARFPHHHANDPRQNDAAVADDWCWGAESDGEAFAGDGRCSTQGAAGY